MSKHSILVTLFIISMQAGPITHATHRTPEALEDRIAAIGQITFSDVSASADTQDPGQPKDGLAVYTTYCAACHSTGVSGAPVAGDPDDWEDRIEQGMELLVKHAIEGFTGTSGIMLPKGGFPQLSDEEVALAVEHMVEQSR